MTAEQWQILIPAILAFLGALTGLLHQRGKAKAATGQAGELAKQLEVATSIPPECKDCEHSKTRATRDAAKASCTDCLAKLGELERRLGRVGDTVSALAKLGGVALPAPELPPERD